GMVKIGRRRGEVAPVEKGVTALGVVAVGTVRIEADRLGVVGDGVVELAHGNPHLAATAIGISVFWGDPDRVAVVIYGTGEVALVVPSGAGRFVRRQNL